ncbi:MAG TPA: S49 family peptidase [Armatimonadota bacterium]|nr:S49 family peptidase [Armatimonadota bacterium]
MADWNEIFNEIKASGSTYDVVRRTYLTRLFEITNRNIIIYYSGWLQKPGWPGTELNDGDKNGFMNAIHGLDRSLGLDLILHTPGGETAATESLVDYLRSMFGTGIRAIVPQLALSSGTMIACACEQIIMGKHSSLGPIDPQFQNIPAHGVVEEFKRAHQEIKSDQSKAFVWQPIIAKYPPAFIGECEKAIQWSTEMVKEWLLAGMLKDKENAGAMADTIIAELGDHALTKSHARHLSIAKCRQMGLDVVVLEDDHKLQDAVLSVHHACIHTLSATAAYKIIENHKGIAFIQIAHV